MAQYLQQHSTLTLFQGMEELRRIEGNNDNDFAEKSTTDFLALIEEHDLIHVLFGCSTDVAGEIKAHIWTAFGTTTKLKVMRDAVGNQNHKDAIREIGQGNLIRAWTTIIPIAIRIIGCAVRMKKKFPVEQASNYLHIELDKIRHEFGIQVV